MKCNDQSLLRVGPSIAAALMIALGAQAAPPVTDGLILDLRLSEAVIDGVDVIGVSDLSGRGNHAGGGVAPLYQAGATPSGQAVMSFDGASQYLEIGASPDFDGRAKTTFVVFRAHELGVGRMINSAFETLDPDNPGASAHYSVGSAFANAAGGGVFRIQNRSLTGGGIAVSTPNATVSTGAFHVGINLWRDDGTISAIVLNENGDRSVGNTSGATANPQGHIWTRLGANAGTGNPAPQDFFHGDIAAVLVFNRALEAGELALMENYLHETYLIPEPSSIALILGSCATLLLVWRRRALKRESFRSVR